MIRAAIIDLPIEYRDRFVAILKGPAESMGALRGELAAYLVTVQQVGALTNLYDLRLAERICEVLTELVVWSEARSADTQRLVGAAVIYFVREEDDEEITGVLGFDDDVQVVNAVCRAVGRPELVVPFRREELDDLS